MKKLNFKPVAMAFALLLAVALFGTPSSPVAGVVPTVGGEAIAYAPCVNEYMVMEAAYDTYLAYPNPWNWFAYYDALTEYLGCMAG